MRMVLDTIVLVSALINPGGLPNELLQRWESAEFELVTSAAQLDELQRVLSYKKLLPFIRPEQASRLLAAIRHFATLAEELSVPDVSRAAADNVIIAAAVAGNASHLVTGDKAHLLTLGNVQGVSIISVRQAIQLLTEHPSQ